MPTDPTPLQQILDAALPLLVAIITVVFAKLGAAIQSKVKSEQASAILLRVNDQARDVVLELEQTTAGAMREMSRDGKLDAADISNLKDTALTKLSEQIGTKGKDDILKLLGYTQAELEAVLRTKLEAEVNKARAVVVAAVKPQPQHPPPPPTRESAR